MGSKMCKSQENALARQSDAHNEDQKRQQRAQKRLAAVKEIIETEKTYVNRLKLCIDTYYKDLSENNKLVSAKDLKGIFNDIQTIHQLNETFLNDLQIVYAAFDNENTMIGDQFVKFCPYFRMYQNYCNNYESAAVLLEKYNNRPTFKSFCADIRDQKCNGQPLASLLILPIQRLPRYKLGLSEIIKNTELHHPDLDDLHRALELVEETTTLINERMTEFELRQKVREIESRFNNLKQGFLKPHRKFVKEASMTKVNRRGKDRTYTFFLFNDILCYASGDKNSLKLHTILPIDPAFSVDDIPHHEKYSDCSFEIHSSVKSFIVYCETHNEKKQWLDELRKVSRLKMNKQLSRDNIRHLAAPLMVPDDWCDECQMMDCDNKFSFVNRRHHCRYCGKLVCNKCGKYKLAARTNKDRVVKPVCKVCFGLYKDEYPAKANAKELQYEEADSDGSNDESKDGN